MKLLLEKLGGGDRRSLGKAQEVAAEVRAKPGLFRVLIQGMLQKDPLIAMRAADAVEKITSEHPEYLRPYKRKLIEQIAAIGQQEVRWHVAQLFPRLEWTAQERRRIIKILFEYLGDKSRIVQVFSMQALTDLVAQDANLRNAVIRKITAMIVAGSPAVKSRGKKLLGQLKGTMKRRSQSGSAGGKAGKD